MANLLVRAPPPTGSALPHPVPVANSSPMTDTSRLDELEMRVVHQDETIEDLNAAITAQWKLIEQPSSKIRSHARTLQPSSQAFTAS